MITYEEMKDAVLDGDPDAARELAETALKENMEINRIMDEGFLAGIQEAGSLYEDGEYFLPDLVCAAEAMKQALAVLDSAIKASGISVKSTGKAALVTVQGDVHDIGKTIVGAMMTAAGYEVYDLGTDIANEEVLNRVRELDPDILGLSAMLTTTMQEQRNIINTLKEAGLRDDLKIIIGGAPVSQKWADEIGADGYSDNAIAAVRLSDRLCSGEESK